MKLLKVVFVILIIITLTEVGYYIYLQLKTKYDKAIFTPSISTNTEAYKDFKTEQAIHPTVLEQLKRYIKSPESRMYILSEETAKVLEIAKDGACVEDWRDGKLYPGKICFPFALKLENKTLPEGYIWNYFTERQMTKLNVYIKDGDQLEKSAFNQIRNNDLITAIEKWDPSVEIDLSNLKDTLDKQMIEMSLYILKNK